VAATVLPEVVLRLVARLQATRPAVVALRATLPVAARLQAIHPVALLPRPVVRRATAARHKVVRLVMAVLRKAARPATARRKVTNLRARVIPALPLPPKSRMR